jgi:hypothetical protein
MISECFHVYVDTGESPPNPLPNPSHLLREPYRRLHLTSLHEQGTVIFPSEVFSQTIPSPFSKNVMHFQWNLHGCTNPLNDLVMKHVIEIPFLVKGFIIFLSILSVCILLDTCSARQEQSSVYKAQLRESTAGQCYYSFLSEH